MPAQAGATSPWPARLLLLAAVAVTLGGIMLPADTMSWIRENNRNLSRTLSWLEHVLPHFGLVHALLFAGVTLCLRWLWPRRPIWQVFAVMLVFAVCSELLQYLAPGRRPRIRDIGDDVAGIVLGLLLAAVIGRLRRPGLAAASLAAARWLAVAAMLLLPWQRWPWGAAAEPDLLPVDIVLLLAMALRGVAALGGLPVQLARFHAWLAAVLVLAAVGVVFSSETGTSLVAWFGAVYLVLAAALLCDLGGDERWLRRLVLAWVVGALVVAALAVAAAFVYWFWPEAKAGYVPLLATRTSAGAWGWLPRIRSGFTTVHEFGGFLCVSLALVMACGRLGWWRPGVTVLASLGLLAAGVLAWSPAFGATALVAGACGWFLLRPDHPRRARLALMSGVGVAGALLLVAVLDPSDPWGSASVRVQVWRAALEAIALQPWTGSGLGLPVVKVLASGPDGLRWLGAAHDVWLSVAAQAGLPAMFALAGLVVHVLRRGREPEPGAMTLRRALWLAFAAAWLCLGLVTAVEAYLHLWLCMGLLMATAAPEKRAA